MFPKFKLIVVMLLIMALALAALPGCDDADKETILKHANKAYVSIRLIVTDPAILPLISEKNLAILQKAEDDYLAAVGIWKKLALSRTRGVTAADKIATCADTIIELLDAIELPEKYETKIAAVRVVVKVLRVQLE
jgi:hypothetical protein